jgi:hypothetical protein
MVTKEALGVFQGRTLVQMRGEIGGARHVFLRKDGIDDFVQPFPFGAQVKNPFKGAAKIYAGDLCYMKYDDRVEKPELYLLKTYEVYSAEGTTVNIVKNGYRHIPFVGDTLTIAPDVIGGEGEALSVVGVKTTTIDKQLVWAVTLAAEPATAPAKGDILVEANADGSMLVDNINGVAACDYDFLFNPAADPTDEEDYDGARYLMMPVMGGYMYKYRMSPLPKCVEALNIANINGVFGIHALHK